MATGFLVTTLPDFRAYSATQVLNIQCPCFLSSHVFVLVALVCCHDCLALSYEIGVAI